MKKIDEKTRNDEEMEEEASRNAASRGNTQ